MLEDRKKISPRGFKVSEIRGVLTLDGIISLLVETLLLGICLRTQGGRRISPTHESALPAFVRHPGSEVETRVERPDGKKMTFYSPTESSEQKV